MGNLPTAFKIMGVAEELIQKQGYNAFSYRDLSKRIGIKTSSIHYHFPRKNDLVRAVMERYHNAFLYKLESFNSEKTAKKKLKAYISMFIETFRQGRRICLYASLASDLDVLPDDVRSRVSHFVNAHEKWLLSVLRQGIDSGEFRKFDNLSQTARNIFYTFEGAMLVARTSTVKRIEDAGKWIFTLLSPV